MNVYGDTSFLCALYRRQVNSPKAIAFMGTRTGPIPVSSLLLLEFRQSLRLQVWLHSKDKTKGFSKHEATQMLRDLHADMKNKVLETVPADWSVVHLLAEDISSRYTEQNGHRLADILHVATALHLGASEFLTFDANQRRLAQAEGLKVTL